MEMESLIILVSSTLLLSYISSLIYEKTRVPDIVWLMGLGLVVGPLLRLFDKGVFLEVAPLMSIVALSVILFDAGLNINVNELLEIMGKSLVLASLSLFSVIFIVGFTLSFLLPNSFSLLQGMLLGAMVGGTSTVSTYGVLSSLQRSIKNLGSTKVLLTMESIVSDPLCIVTSITIIRMIMLPDVSVWGSAVTIMNTFTLSSLYGLGIGLLWAKILDRLRDRPFSYMITMAVLIPTYIMGEKLIGEGSGAMAALMFGLAITNYGFISKRLGINSKMRVDKQRLREFHEEITFFIKSFFFVYIGLVVSFSYGTILLGVVLAILLMCIRYMLVSLISGPLNFSLEEKTVSRYVFAMGLPAFVMSQLPMIFDPTGMYFTNSSIYPNLCMPIVLGTVFYGALFAPYAIKRTSHIYDKPYIDTYPIEQPAS